MIDIYFFSRMPGTIIASIIGLVAGLLYSKPDWGLRRVSGESGRVEKKNQNIFAYGAVSNG